MTSIIIPTMNHLDDLLRPCLESIKQYTNLEGVEVLVVANGCTDGTRAYVESLGPPFRLIWSDEALGCTGAENRGLKEARGEYMVLLNNDCILLPQTKDAWLNMLKEPFLRDPLVGESGIVELTCPHTQEKFLLFFCVMIHRKTIAAIGYLDEATNFGMGDDTDFSIRVRSAGMKTAIAAASNVKDGTSFHSGDFPLFHKGEGTFNDNPNWGEVSQTHNELLRARKVLGHYNTVRRIDPDIIKLNLGCGDWLLKGYINCDLYDSHAEVCCDARSTPFLDNTVDEIYTSHLIEHFDFFEGFKVLEEWKRVLRPGGKVVIETPDLAASCKKFSQLYETQNWPACNEMYSHFFSTPWQNPGQVHKFLYTPVQLHWTLEQGRWNNIRQEPAVRFIGREDICMKFVAEK